MKETERHDGQIHVEGNVTFCSCLYTGAPPEEFLDQPITSSDHPFLRANANSVAAYKKSIGGTSMKFLGANVLCTDCYENGKGGIKR